MRHQTSAVPHRCATPTAEPSSEPGKDEDAVAFTRQCQLTGLPLDTCLQYDSTHLQQKVTQLDDDMSTYSLAPGEHNVPLSIIFDDHFEELAFVDKFLYGRFGCKADIAVRLYLSRYVNSRLLDVDPRCSSDVDYIFAMQYAQEYQV